jgi:hypothetical protein
VGVDKADAGSIKAMPLNKGQNFLVGSGLRITQVLKSKHHRLPIGQSSHRQFSHDEIMRKNLPGFEKARHAGIAAVEMIDPNRGIDQYHALERRRGTGRSCFCVPPNLANLRDASVSTRDFNAAFTSAVFSLMPV